VHLVNMYVKEWGGDMGHVAIVMRREAGHLVLLNVTIVMLRKAGHHVCVCPPGGGVQDTWECGLP